jgi:hypothetical protein
MKSYVTIEQAACPVCCKVEDTGAILMDTRLTYDHRTGRSKMRETFDMHTVTGWSPCKEHRDLYAAGYVAFVGVKREPHRNADPGDIERTGAVMHLRLATAEAVLTGGWPKARDGRPLPLIYCPDELIDKIVAMCKAQGVEPIDPKDATPTPPPN